MVTSALLKIIYIFVWTITLPIQLLADVSVSAGLGEAISESALWLKNIDGVVPVDIFLTIVFLTLTIEGGVALYKLIMWIIRRVPGQG